MNHLKNSQAGDVLLLEAGPTFISRNTDNQQSFALISEVKDSKPPRLDKLIPALVLVLVMLITGKRCYRKVVLLIFLLKKNSYR